jgi:hypothetical protein
MTQQATKLETSAERRKRFAADIADMLKCRIPQGEDWDDALVVTRIDHEEDSTVLAVGAAYFDECATGFSVSFNVTVTDLEVERIEHLLDHPVTA